jgi:ribosomal protein S18 acetylase RimI-like enzyme
MMTEAAVWLRSRGIPQWTFFLTEAGKDFVRNRITTAETYLYCEADDRPIATFSLYWKDEETWGEHGLDNKAGYVHGLAVRRHASGKNIGRTMLDLASALIVRKSRNLLRLDCMAQNESLCNYYRRMGFADLGVGQSTITSKSLRLFERDIMKSGFNEWRNCRG